MDRERATDPRGEVTDVPETYTDEQGVEYCDICQEELGYCTCVCDECGDNIHECACDDED